MLAHDCALRFGGLEYETAHRLALSLSVSALLLYQESPVGVAELDTANPTQHPCRDEESAVRTLSVYTQERGSVWHAENATNSEQTVSLPHARTIPALSACHPEVIFCAMVVMSIPRQQTT